jgi:tetratricopeptide (TPR) repeat protein
VLALTARYEPAGARDLARAAAAAAERALALSAVCSEFRIRRGVARDLQGRWAEAGADFFAAVEIAPADAVAWYYLADHLGRGNQVSREPAEAALAYCLKLDPNFAPAYALRERFEQRRRRK